MVVTKAIIPAAGFGTRFLPATKVIPKEMLPIIDKPAIQYVVEEGIRSGIKSFVMVTEKSKRPIEDHFDSVAELDLYLRKKKQSDKLNHLSRVLSTVNFISVRQKEALGLGHAVWTARHAVGKEYVAVMLPDEIITGSTPGLRQLIKIAAQEKCNVVAVQEVPIDQVPRYGIVDIKRQFSPTLFQLKDLVEKPSINKAPSNLAIVGRYVLSPRIFETLEKTGTGAVGEIQLTDGIQNLLLSGEKVFAYKIPGTRYDVGNPLGLLKASISMALKHPEYSKDIQAYLNQLDKDMLVIEGKAESLEKQSFL